MAQAGRATARDRDVSRPLFYQFDEVHVRIATSALVGIVAVAACAGTVVRQYGEYTTFSPRVSTSDKQPRPTKVTVQLAKPANVAVFLVTPGRTPTLLYPADSTQSTYVDAGTHEVTTALANKPATRDTSRLVRRPSEGVTTRGGMGQRGGSRDTMGTMMDRRLGATSYLLIYASQEPLSFKSLSTKVQGLTIPAEDNEALNTVTKLIHGTQQGAGPWAAWATEM